MFNFIKAGIMLLDLQDSSVEQGETDLKVEPTARGHLMGTLDKLNDPFGRGTVLLDSAGLEGKVRTSPMKQNLFDAPVHDSL